MHADLAARCETAEGPDRALDAAIARAIRWDQDETGEWHAAGVFFNDGTIRRTSYAVDLPAFTASVDCALTLVSDGMWWLIGKGRTRPDEPLYGVQILDGERVVAEAETEASAALAICAAALRARAG